MPTFEELARAQAAQMMQSPALVLANPIGAALVGAAAGARPNGFQLADRFAQRDLAAIQQAEVRKLRALQLLKAAEQMEEQRQEREMALAAAAAAQRELFGKVLAPGLAPGHAVALWNAQTRKQDIEARKHAAEMVARMYGLPPEAARYFLGQMLTQRRWEADRVEEQKARQAFAAAMQTAIPWEMFTPQQQAMLNKLAVANPRAASLYAQHLMRQASGSYDAAIAGAIQQRDWNTALSLWMKAKGSGLRTSINPLSYIERSQLSNIERQKLVSSSLSNYMSLYSRVMNLAATTNGVIRVNTPKGQQLKTMINLLNQIGNLYIQQARQLGWPVELPWVTAEGNRVKETVLRSGTQPPGGGQVNPIVLGAAPLPQGGGEQVGQLQMPPQLQALEQLEQLKREHGLSLEPRDVLYSGWLGIKNGIGLPIGDRPVTSKLGFLAGNFVGWMPWLLLPQAAGARAVAVGTRLASRAGLSMLEKLVPKAASWGANAVAFLGPELTYALTAKVPKGMSRADMVAAALNNVGNDLFMLWVFGGGARWFGPVIERALTKVTGPLARGASKLGPKVTGWWESLLKGTAQLTGGASSVMLVKKVLLGSPESVAEMTEDDISRLALLYAVGKFFAYPAAVSAAVRAKVGKAASEVGGKAAERFSGEKATKVAEKVSTMMRYINKVEQNPKLRQRILDSLANKPENLEKVREAVLKAPLGEDDKRNLLRLYNILRESLVELKAGQRVPPPYPNLPKPPYAVRSPQDAAAVERWKANFRAERDARLSGKAKQLAGKKQAELLEALRTGRKQMVEELRRSVGPLRAAIQSRKEWLEFVKKHPELQKLEVSGPVGTGSSEPVVRRGYW